MEVQFPFCTTQPIYHGAGPQGGGHTSAPAPRTSPYLIPAVALAILAVATVCTQTHSSGLWLAGAPAVAVPHGARPRALPARPSPGIGAGAMRNARVDAAGRSPPSPLWRTAAGTDDPAVSGEQRVWTAA